MARMQLMRPSALLILSLAANALLAVALLMTQSASPLPQRQAATEPAVSLIRTQQVLKPVKIVKTNFMQDNFSWQQVEAAEYPAYIANLRRIGCPETTIRDIIVADVNNLYARRRSEEVYTSVDQWWRAEPDPNALEINPEKLESLDRERRGLLAQLLGPNWEQQPDAAPASRRATGRVISLTGPILSKLTPATEQALQTAYLKMRQTSEAYIYARRNAGQAEDPAETARIRREFRAELDRLLSPEQAEEFLLRHSAVSQQMRAQLGNLNLTPDEFRAVFRARDLVDRQLGPADYANSDASARRRAALDNQADAALKLALSPERYQQYKGDSDPGYREARLMAQTVGASPEAVQTINEIQRAVKAEEARIRADAALTTEQRGAQLEEARQAHQNALRQLLGEEGFRRWEQNYSPAK